MVLETVAQARDVARRIAKRLRRRVEADGQIDQAANLRDQVDQGGWLRRLGFGSRALDVPQRGSSGSPKKTCSAASSSASIAEQRMKSPRAGVAGESPRQPGGAR